MNTCLSHQTALSYLLRMRNPRVHEPRPCRAKAIPASMPSVDEAAWLYDVLAHDLPEGHDRLDVLVSSQAGRHSASVARPHLCTTTLPDGSFVPIVLYGTEVHLSSPELVYLQMAESLGTEALVYVGYALCSNYRLDDLEQGGVAIRTDSGDEPLTSVERIRSYLGRLPQGTRNLAKALKALDYVREGARSPMEAGIAMCINLPSRLGGHAIGDVRLNPELRVYDGVGRRGEARYETRYPDILVSARGRDGIVRHVDVEYSPLVTHGSPDRMLGDGERDNLLSPVDDLSVITLAKEQVRSYRLFTRQLDRIRRALKRRARPHLAGNADSERNMRKMAEVESRRFELWKLVLSRDRMTL